MFRNSQNAIDDFLTQKRIAFVGLSRRTNDFSRALYLEFIKRGYDVVAVNPKANDAYPRVSDIRPMVDAALVMTTPEVANGVVYDCARAGVKRVWLYRSSETAVRFCQSKGISVIAGECPFMFLENTGVIHRVHGWLCKITGHYPQAD